MKLITGILIFGMATVSTLAQNPEIIQNTRNQLKAVEHKKTADSNAALESTQASPATPASSPSPFARPVSNTSVKAPARVVGVKSTGTKGKQAHPKQRIAVEDKKKPVDAKKEASRVINITGRRDPFISPVVNRSMVGSGCSSGKRCLSIGDVNLKGVVRSDAGMIAVVVNTLNKAYFLRENDPVFNGYVVKITDNSIVFKETMQDKLGKSFTREVTKKIITPAV
jgi:Tfp pilus assembly protein PilP